MWFDYITNIVKNQRNEANVKQIIVYLYFVCTNVVY